MLSYIFLTLFCASLTTRSVISEFSARFTVLFFIFDAPNLKMFGMLSISLFISFLPMSDPKAFDPRSKPAFTRLDPSPLPDC